MPPIYSKAFSAVDPTNVGETSVNALSRVLGTSSLSASTIDRVMNFFNRTRVVLNLVISQIVNLVSSRPRVSKLEFFVALALVALAQEGRGEYSPIAFLRSSPLSHLISVFSDSVIAH